MQTSKSLTVAQDAIPLFPFADETKTRVHAIFLLSPAFLSDAHLIVLALPRRCSCCTFPEARVPPGASRPSSYPGRNHERHVRCESQALADGFRPELARPCLFLPECPADECRSTGCRRPWLDLAISTSVLPPNHSV